MIFSPDLQIFDGAHMNNIEKFFFKIFGPKYQLSRTATRLGLDKKVQAEEQQVDYTFNYNEEIKRSRDKRETYLHLLRDIKQKINENKTVNLSIDRSTGENYLSLEKEKGIIDQYVAFNQLYINGINEVKIDHCNSRNMTIKSTSVSIRSSIISELDLRSSRKLHIENSWIGVLAISEDDVQEATFYSCKIGCILIAKSHSDKTNLGSVQFKKTSIATRHSESAFYTSEAPIRDLYRLMEKSQNSAAAHFFRGLVLRAEHYNETGFMRFVSWFYGFFGNFGLSPGRAVAWIFGTLLFSVFVMGYFEGAYVVDHASHSQDDMSPMWLRELGTNYYALILTLQTMLNPFYVFTAKQLVAAKSACGQAFVTFVGFFSLSLYAVLILSIRRRFKVRE